MRIEFEKVSSYSINKFSNTKLEFRQDEISSIILANSNINDLEPCIIATDGNCLFRSVSKALYGTENYHEEIRFRCVFELTENLDLYLDKTNYDNEFYVDLLGTISPSSRVNRTDRQIFEEEIIRCSKLKEWGSSLMIFGICNALKININQVYPRKNFRDENLASLLSQKISPLNEQVEQVQMNIYLMWTSTYDTELESNWSPNHFVCCFKKDEAHNTVRLALYKI